MKEYMLLFRSSSDALKGSAEELQQQVVRWKSWLDKLAAEGTFGSGGKRLNAAGTTIRGRERRTVDGPYAEGKEVVGGYMTIKARDLGEAVEIVKGCPIFDIGGSAEVREALG